jgi:hypothetical protein
MVYVWDFLAREGTITRQELEDAIERSKKSYKDGGFGPNDIMHSLSLLASLETPYRSLDMVKTGYRKFLGSIKVIGDREWDDVVAVMLRLTPDIAPQPPVVTSYVASALYQLPGVREEMAVLGDHIIPTIFSRNPMAQFEALWRPEFALQYGLLLPIVQRLQKNIKDALAVFKNDKTKVNFVLAMETAHVANTLYIEELRS